MKEFKLNKKEEALSEEFIKKHMKDCKVVNASGFTVGPLFTYSFTPTGIGIATTIKCSVCKEEQDITDVENW